MLKINDLKQLYLGVIGENLFRTIEIDMSEWLEILPNGIASIVCIRPGETPEDAYIANTTFEDGILRWTISAGDLGSVRGRGAAQIWLEEETTGNVTKRGKSTMVITQVDPGPEDPSETPPAPQQSWMQAMTALKDATVAAAASIEENYYTSEAYAKGTRGGQDVSSDDPAYHNNSLYYSQQAGTSATEAGTAKTAAEAARDAARAAMAHYPYINPDTGKWMVWDPETGAFVSTGKDAQGPQGINAFLHIRYAAAQPSADADMKTTPDAWIGIYSGDSATAPTAYTSYTWYKYKGETGAAGADGSDGQSAYMHIRYAAAQPTADADMKTTPDEWIGIYGGSSATAPTTYTSYTWYKIKGETGSAANVYGSTVPMSPLDSTKVDAAIAAKFDAAAIADAFDSTQVYAEGDKVSRDGKVYVRKSWGADTPAAESWDATHWDEEDPIQEQIDGKADETDTKLLTTLSRGRDANATIGSGSFAFGFNVEASGTYSHAEGGNTTASGNCAHAENGATNAIGYCSHAEGVFTSANGEGAHAEGHYTKAMGGYSHVSGRYNVEDEYDLPDWESGTYYAVGDKVKRGSGLLAKGYKCKTANSDVYFTSSNWDEMPEMKFAEIVGNGESSLDRSNARALDWEGNEYLGGDLYVNCDENSTNGTPVGAAIEKLHDDLDITISGGKAYYNGSAVAVTAGQFVSVIDDAITGVSKGLYTAKNGVSSGDSFTSTDLEVVTAGGLNALNSKLTTETISNFFTPDTTKCSFSAGYTYCKKIGNIIEMQLGIVPTVTSGALGTLSDGAKPSNSVFSIGSNVTDEKPQGIFILGSTLIAYGITSGKVFVIHFTYIQ